MHIVDFGQDNTEAPLKPLSVIVLASVKDSTSWGTNRGFLDFLDMLINITHQTPNTDISIGLLVSDKTYSLDLGLVFTPDDVIKHKQRAKKPCAASA